MINDLLTIYNNIRNMYEISKDEALVIRDLNISKGSNISEEIKKCDDRINDYDKKLEIIDIVFRFIILQYIKGNNNQPIDINETFDKFKFELIMSPK